MLSLPSMMRIFVCTEPADMRRSFDGLGRMVEEIVKEDPLTGHLFVFVNKRQDRAKILYWDRDGYAIWYKRLEEGTFRVPFGVHASGRVELTPAELSLFLGGIELMFTRKRKRYKRNKKGAKEV